MRRVYIAGSLDPGPTPGVEGKSLIFIDNIRQMILEGNKIRDIGASPYIPCLNILESLICGTFKTHQHYLNDDLVWVAICDAVYIIPNKYNKYSKGVAGEVKFAEENNIPVFYNIEELKKYLEGENDNNR